MYRQKLCLGLNPQFGADGIKQIELLADTGFDAFFTDWKRGIDITPFVKKGIETGLEYQFIHAPFGGCCDLWEEDNPDAEDFENELIECIHLCSNNNIPVMVSHTFIGFEYDNVPTAVGLERYGRVVKEAEKCGITVAFENTEGEEFLKALMDEFKDCKNVGFCWDSGHEMCYNFSRDMLNLYGDRLICTHLNDNLGIKDYGGKITYIDDLHLLPFDGIADWQYNVDRLNKCGYDGILTFELNTKSKPGRFENDIYADMSTERYFAEVYKRACKIATMKMNCK